MQSTAYPNETIRLLLERASCRSFADRKIEPEVLETLLKAGVHAPTAGNLQPFSIIKVENPDTSKKLAHLCGNQMFIAQAPLNLLFCIDWRRNKRWAALEVAPFSADLSFRHFWVSFQDTVMSAQNICTAADALGLGSVYVGTVLECFRELKELFALPSGVFPVVLLSVGYPKVYPAPRKKLGLDIMVHCETYRDPSDEELLDAHNAKYASYAPIEATPERVETIQRVCTEVHGTEFAERCVSRIRDAGRINIAQRYFGLHYRADVMPKKNADFLKIVEEFGFGWFKAHVE